MTEDRPDDFGFGDGGFCKLYGDRLADSSLLECAVASRWIFLYMLARADSEGRFRCATVAGLARSAAVSLAEAERAIVELEAPDPDSSSPDNDGRRIIRFPGGWQIVTYAKYRDYQTKRQRAEAARKRRQREAERTRQEAQGGTCPGTSRGHTHETSNVKRQTPSTTEAPSSTSKRKTRPTVSEETVAAIQRFDRVFQRATGRRASLPPSSYRDFAARLADGYPEGFLVGLPVGWVATAAPDAERMKAVRPDYLLRDGSRSYRRGDEVRPTFDWVGSVWGALDRVRLTPAQEALLADVGALDWWKAKGARPAQETKEW